MLKVLSSTTNGEPPISTLIHPRDIRVMQDDPKAPGTVGIVLESLDSDSPMDALASLLGHRQAVGTGHGVQVLNETVASLVARIAPERPCFVVTTIPSADYQQATGNTGLLQSALFLDSLLAVVEEAPDKLFIATDSESSRYCSDSFDSLQSAVEAFGIPLVKFTIRGRTGQPARTFAPTATVNALYEKDGEVRLLQEDGAYICTDSWEDLLAQLPNIHPVGTGAHKENLGGRVAVDISKINRAAVLEGYVLSIELDTGDDIPVIDFTVDQLFALYDAPATELQPA